MHYNIVVISELKSIHAHPLCWLMINLDEVAIRSQAYTFCLFLCKQAPKVQLPYRVTHLSLLLE